MYSIEVELESIETEFRDTIFLDVEHIGPRINNYDLNHIRQFQGILLGRPGSGKTQSANWIAKQLVDKYGEDEVNAVCCNNLGTLLESVDDKLVNFLFLDDYTLTKSTKKELANYFKIRHIIQSRTGMVLTVLGLHRFYGCDPSIRTNFDFLFFRSAPTNKFDRNWVKSYIGQNSTDALSSIEMDRNKDNDLYDITLAWVKGCGHGYISTPLAEKKYLSMRGPRPLTKKELYRRFKETKRQCAY